MRKARDPISSLKTAIDCLPARTRQELRTLEHLLEASLAEEETTDLAAAIAEHRAAVDRRVPEIIARRLRPSHLRSQRDRLPDERTSSLNRVNVSSPIVS